MIDMITLLHIKNDGAVFDISSLVEQVKWGGRKGSAARYIEVSLFDCDKNSHKRAEIDAEKGERCIFYWDKVELFRGIIMSQSQSDKAKMPIKAYDLGIHLANSKDTFSYKNKTASQIFVDCCNRLQIPYSDVAETGYVINELPKPKTTYFDVIQDALSQTFKAKGERFFPLAQEGQMRLIHRKDNVLQWVIEPGVNLTGYTYKKSIEKVKTRVKLLSNKDKVLQQAVNNELENKIGMFAEIETPSDDLNTAQLKELVESTLKEKGKTEKSLTISGIGIPDIISGVAVFVLINKIGISQTFYVDQDTHTFKGNKHTMSLTLNMADDY